MTKNRIASTVAFATFGLAALGGIALAAPGNADAGSGRGSDSSSSVAGPRASVPSASDRGALSSVVNGMLQSRNDANSREALHKAAASGGALTSASAEKLGETSQSFQLGTEFMSKGMKLATQAIGTIVHTQ